MVAKAAERAWFLAQGLEYLGGVAPSRCWECGEGKPPPMVYVLGQIDFDIGSAACRDSFVQSGVEDPDNPDQLLAHLDDNPAEAAAVTWTLNQDTVPIYAIQPGGAFASGTYALIREILAGQHHDGVERVSVPGWMEGSVRLSSGQSVPMIWPETRGLYSWNTTALVKAVLDKKPRSKRDQDKAFAIGNFLGRVYYEVRNLGTTPQERALNYAATNAFQAERVFESAFNQGLRLDSFEVESSPICRTESDCWDVKMTFFNPRRRFEEARQVYRFTIDVSDVVPVTVGALRQWHVY